MKRQIQLITAAWLFMALHTVAVSCSNATVSNNQWLDGLRISLAMMSRGGLYQGAPAPLLAPTSGNISAVCQQELDQILQNTKALDAFGKPGAGLMEGDVVWLGNYDECLSLEGFNYCLTDMKVNGTMLGIKGLAEFVIRWGICPPASCSDEDLMRALQYLLSFLDKKYVSFEAVSAAGITCATSPPIPYSAGVICTTVLLSVLGVLMIVGSLYDEYLKLKLKLKLKKRKAERRWLYYSVQDEDGGDEDDDEDDSDEQLLGQDVSQQWRISFPRVEPQSIFAKFLLCFAATRNLSKLLDTRQKDTSIGSLNGIRVISMSWVILAHALVISLSYGTAQNPVVLLEWLSGFGFQAISNAFFAVDSFFFLSGCLISYLTLSRMQELRSAKAWAWFYFHRYWRLSPVLGLTILVWMYIQPFFGDSPVWYTTLARPLCEKYWWTNFLYINNFYPQGFASQCIGWTWYLANDMQFFIISPLLLVPLYYYPVFGAFVLYYVTVVCTVATVVVMIIYKASVDIVGTLTSQQSGYALDDESLIYEKPYSRIAPYLVGIALGYFMHRTGKRKVKMAPLIAIVGWVVATAIAISVVYGFYPSYHSGIPLTRAGQVVYGSVSRFAWAVALAWVVFACKYGYGGWINGFLSWTGWIPLSRITYATYMFHPIVYVTFYNNFGTPIYESKYLMAYYFAGNLLLSYFIALIVALAVEYPFANLEKLFMPNSPKEIHERHHKDLKL